MTDKVSKVQIAKRKFAEQYLGPGMSIGIGQDDGEFVIRVAGLPESTADLPETFDGVRVVIKGQGPVRSALAGEE